MSRAKNINNTMLSNLRDEIIYILNLQLKKGLKDSKDYMTKEKNILRSELSSENGGKKKQRIKGYKARKNKLHIRIYATTKSLTPQMHEEELRPKYQKGGFFKVKPLNTVGHFYIALGDKRDNFYETTKGSLKQNYKAKKTFRKDGRMLKNGRVYLEPRSITYIRRRGTLNETLKEKTEIWKERAEKNVQRSLEEYFRLGGKK